MADIDDLDAHDRHLYEERLGEGHNWEVSVDLQNRNGDTLVSFDEDRGGGRAVVVEDGSVSLRGPSRLLRLTVADPYGTLLVGQDGNYIDRELHVRVGVFVPKLADTIWTSVHAGPIYNAPRTGDRIQFIAHGVERYGKSGIAKPYTVKKGTKITDAIRQILIDLCRFLPRQLGNIPDLPMTLKDDLLLHIKSWPWTICEHLADQVDRYIACDGKRDVQMPRVDNDTPYITFTGDGGKEDNGLIVGDPPDMRVSRATLHNAVEITGGASKGTKPPVGYAICDDAHFPGYPYTVEKIGYHWDTRTLPQYKKQSGVDGAAKNILARDLRLIRRAAADIIPIPHLYFGMPFGLATQEIPLVVDHLMMFDLPLLLEGDPGPTMSINYSKRSSSDILAGRNNAA